MRTPKGFAEAVTKIRSSAEPLKMWWRPVLKGNAVNEVLALPTFHRKPTAGIKLGVFGADATEAGLKAVLDQASERYWRD